ncbi:MAG: tagaturonate reductase [Paraglaciecola sp.]|uniref:tagaturonate reductase n=1 Tax=Paraglaciecola sp. TaxID=1920173 RepID=UPI00329A7310
MKPLNRQFLSTKSYPTKIMQFGSGNFLRGFIDWQIEHLNKTTPLNAGISIIRPRPVNYNDSLNLNDQDGLYTTLVRGLNEQGEVVEDIQVIECVNEEIPIYEAFEQYLALATNPELKIIFSNTTEAGIEFISSDKLTDAPAKAFPAKLTQWLFKRFKHFNGSAESGLMIIPCELIDYNGEKLKEIVLQYSTLWDLGADFESWLHSANHFCSTLVDRIVPGFPYGEEEKLQDKLGYADDFLVAAEYFHFLVIQGPESLNQLLCLDNTSLNIRVVEDIYPYKQRKVAILNGAHTALVPLAYMAGIDSVGEAMNDALFENYIHNIIFDEIIPTLDLPKDELQGFALDVIKRFKNPYIHHLLLSIALNSMTKVETRILPQLCKYVETYNKVPNLMAHAIAAQIYLYSGMRDGQTIALSDNPKWLELMRTGWQAFNQGTQSLEALVVDVLSAKWQWQRDLTEITGLVALVNHILVEFLNNGVRDTLAKALEE